MDDATTVAVGTVVLGALLGGVVQIWQAWMDRLREGRAAARVIGDTLTDAMKAADRGQHDWRSFLHQDFARFAPVWAEERKPLARMVRTEEYAKVSEAFSTVTVIATIQTQEFASPHVEAFDAMIAAVQSCEFARRVMHQRALSPRERLARWWHLRGFPAWRRHRRGIRP